MNAGATSRGPLLSGDPREETGTTREGGGGASAHGGVLDRADLLPAPPHRSRLLRPLEWAAAAPWWPQGPTASLAYNPHQLRPSDSPCGFSQACHLRPSHAAFLTPLFGPRSRAALRRTQAVCPPMTSGAVPLCKQPGDRGTWRAHSPGAQRVPHGGESKESEGTGRAGGAPRCWLRSLGDEVASRPPALELDGPAASVLGQGCGAGPGRGARLGGMKLRGGGGTNRVSDRREAPVRVGPSARRGRVRTRGLGT